MYGYTTKLLESFFNTDLKTNLMTLNFFKSRYELNKIMQFLSNFVRPTFLPGSSNNTTISLWKHKILIYAWPEKSELFKTCSVIKFVITLWEPQADSRREALSRVGVELAHEASRGFPLVQYTS